MNKKNRSVNFTKSEIRLLVEIVLKHANILENKQTDTITWKAKQKAWVNITTEFNATNGSIFREIQVLRLKYDCLKRELKKKIANNKLEVYKTGGGTPLIENLTDYEESLLKIIKFNIDGLPARKDSDFQEDLQNQDGQDEHINLYEECIINDNILLDNDKSKEKSSDEITNIQESQLKIITCDNAETTNELIWTPHRLKQAKSLALRSEKYNVNKKYDKIAESRKELLELQILNINYEQERKHKEHEANMKLLEYKKYLLEEEEKRNVEEHVLRKTKLNLEILNLRTFAE